ncbi:amidase domain-containing protein, partial [Paenibacillus chibensis]|uniref:amidase domain-containing protein n=2 Tax=Paenibacillus chibensis TaxID=59846 RepID=UPI002DBEE0B5
HAAKVEFVNNNKSTSWGRVQDFWRHHMDRGVTYYYIGANQSWNESNLKLLRQSAELGDVVHLDSNQGSGFHHSMIVTKIQNGEIYFTYHSGPNNKDVVNIALSNVNSGNDDLWLGKF